MLFDLDLKETATLLQVGLSLTAIAGLVATGVVVWIKYRLIDTFATKKDFTVLEGSVVGLSTRVEGLAKDLASHPTNDDMRSLRHNVANLAARLSGNGCQGRRAGGVAAGHPGSAADDPGHDDQGWEMSLADDLAADRRGVILDLLMREPGYRLSDDMLRLALKALARGVHRITVIQTELSWLEEHRLVRIERAPTEDGSETLIGVLTKAGREVAEGAPHPGVRRPDPR